MPSVLEATTPEERNALRRQAIQVASERGNPLPSQALAFCRQYGEEAYDADILTVFFGIGHERLFHSEGLLAGTDISTMTNLDDLLTTKAQRSILGLPLETRPNTRAFITEARQLYSLRLLNWPPGRQHAQRFIVSSLRHALHRVTEATAYAHLRDLIPRMVRDRHSRHGAYSPSREKASQELFNATLPHLGDIIEEHVSRLAPAYEDPGRIIVGDGRAAFEDGAPQTEYIVMDPMAHTWVRLHHFERDLLQDVSTMPYATWEAEIRQQVSHHLRNQLIDIITAARDEHPRNVTHLDTYRTT